MKSHSDPIILDHLLRNSPRFPETILKFKEWKRGWVSLVPQWETPIDRALAGGLLADRPAWAFAAGYQAAIQSLATPLGLNDTTKISAICITEKDGAHPSRIKSGLVPVPEKPGHWRLNGYKTFISGAEEADVLWVAASTGKSAKGRNQLRMVRVPSQSSGVKLSPMPPLGLVPEMPHAEVGFESVVIPDKALLPGDGYLGAVKPFRTLEDLHVTAAFLAWIFGIGRRGGWPDKSLQMILSLIVSARGLAFAPPLASHVHIALGGFLGQVNQLFKTIDPYWEKIDSSTRKRWQRDRRLLQIAEKARRMRLSHAWQYYDSLAV
jgi:acyl-CoA dehydrogenase